jgi:ABC-type antimicrobial peptide transport system permease subunit
MVMLTIAARVSLLLGMIGIYGVIRYFAAQQTREIGIRMALGTQIGHVRWLSVRHGLVLTFAAVAALATYLPAHRASAIDPVLALRLDI